jgi:CheY-like chemotaxis protein
MVLMDVQMPVMDGLTATGKIRAMELARGRRAVPILALSANARPEDIASSLAAGCTAHLSKPISKQRLLAALDEHANALPAGKPR